MFDSLRSRVADLQRSDQLAFASLLPQETIRSAFGDASNILDSARIYKTTVTIWVFLSQVMSANHGCVAAVTKLIAYRVACGLRPCSVKTGAYCIARDKLDESSMHRLLTDTGEAIENDVPEHWRWLGHRVVTADGTTISMPDTAENQAEYPQQKAQQPGCGFPVMRVVVFFALATGTVLETAMGKYKGKLTAEINLFRQSDHCLSENDVFLGDRAYGGWFDLARLIGRGVHVVVRKHQARKTDFRTGIRYGHDDHAVFWDKPRCRPAWMSVDEYKSYPDFLTLREIRIRVSTPGFRTREIIVVTDLLDDIEYPKDDLAALFRRRWQAELNLRSIKSVMQMDHLRCQEPHRVRNECRAHLLAYNLIRQVMREAALEGGVEPWQISFKGTLTTLLEILPLLTLLGNTDQTYRVLLGCCLTHEVGNRPDRNEPRVIKRRTITHKLMTKPRSQYKPSAN